MHDKPTYTCCIHENTLMAYPRAYVKGAFESLVQMDFNHLNTSCISSNRITSSCHVHASYCCMCLCMDCRHRSLSIGPALETDPEYLSVEQCPLLIYQARKPPCSFRYNPTLSLLLSFIALGQQRFNCYFLLR